MAVSTLLVTTASTEMLNCTTVWCNLFSSPQGFNFCLCPCLSGSEAGAAGAAGAAAAAVATAAAAAALLGIYHRGVQWEGGAVDGGSIIS